MDVRAGGDLRRCNYYHVTCRHVAKGHSTKGMAYDARRYDRRGVGADLVEPYSSRGKMGRPVKNDRRAVSVGDLLRFYGATTSCQWRAEPENYPHWNTCHRYHLTWSRDDTWERVCDRLRGPRPGEARA